MVSNLDNFVNKMVQNAERKIRTDLKNIGSRVKDDFIKQANEAVMLYYANYTPKVYQRTYNLMNNVIDENLTFTVLNGDGSGVWIQFNSNNMEEYKYSDKDAVVSNFMYGIHGKPSIKKDTNPAIDIMNDFQRGYKQNTLDKYFKQLGYIVK